MRNAGNRYRKQNRTTGKWALAAAWHPPGGRVGRRTQLIVILPINARPQCVNDNQTIRVAFGK
ncbi:hypothetical protein M8494_36080 [Serratia ureilytica]